MFHPRSLSTLRLWQVWCWAWLSLLPTRKCKWSGPSTGCGPTTTRRRLQGTAVSLICCQTYIRVGDWTRANFDFLPCVTYDRVDLPNKHGSTCACLKLPFCSRLGCNDINTPPFLSCHDEGGCLGKVQNHFRNEFQST